MDDLQSIYMSALRMAAMKHGNQKMRGTPLTYMVHVTGVAMEVMVAGFQTPDFDTEFAVATALLHDTLEDTEASYREISENYGVRVADAVLALTKFPNLEKPERMKDSIQRIKLLEKEVWAIKLADRIVNLQAPVAEWKAEKRRKYLDGSRNILSELGGGNEYLAQRLARKINDYIPYVEAAGS